LQQSRYLSRYVCKTFPVAPKNSRVRKLLATPAGILRASDSDVMFTFSFVRMGDILFG
jgi:hypothetical protein